PFGRRAPKGVAMLRAKESKVANRPRADCAWIDLATLGLGASKARDQKIDGIGRRPRVVGQPDRAQGAAIAGGVLAFGERRVVAEIGWRHDPIRPFEKSAFGHVEP